MHAAHCLHAKIENMTGDRPSVDRDKYFFKKLWHSSKFITFALLFAQVVELVDALVSGTSGRKVVQVRFLFWAHVEKPGHHWVFLLTGSVVPL